MGRRVLSKLAAAGSALAGGAACVLAGSILSADSVETWWTQVATAGCAALLGAALLYGSLKSVSPVRAALVVLLGLSGVLIAIGAALF